MAAEMGISEATVRRIWRSHGLKPHLVETFKVSNDPLFAENWKPSSPYSSIHPRSVTAFTADYRRDASAIVFRSVDGSSRLDKVVELGSANEPIHLSPRVMTPR